jgi:hypothetical protein
LLTAAVTAITVVLASVLAVILPGTAASAQTAPAARNGTLHVRQVSCTYDGPRQLVGTPLASAATSAVWVAGSGGSLSLGPPA